jgi:hypothetical protein
MRRIEALVKNDGDCCSVCGDRFPHNSWTYGGVVVGREVAVVGQCCVDQMKEIVGVGLYFKPLYDGSNRYH